MCAFINASQTKKKHALT